MDRGKKITKKYPSGQSYEEFLFKESDDNMDDDDDNDSNGYVGCGEEYANTSKLDNWVNWLGREN